MVMVAMARSSFVQLSFLERNQKIKTREIYKEN